jgi:cytochrome b6-f complex iron-sulfur subunit
MAEKKRPSVAEILAAAKKQGAMGSGGGGGAEPAPAAEAAPAPAAETAPAAEAAPPAEKKPAAAKPAAAGARPSVAEMMALARGNAAAGGDAPAAKPAAPAAEKPAAKAAPAAKPAAAKAPTGPAAKAAAGAEAPAKPVAAGPKNTGSILAAARAGAKPGPITKAEAAKKSDEIVVSKSTTKLVVPPMPVKPDYAKPKAKVDTEERRGVLAMLFGSFLAIGFSALTATAGLWSLGLARFLFPNILTEPPSKFKVGFPTDFPAGVVEEKYKALFGVWVVNAEYQGQRQIVAIRTVCTHLGCTPNWLEGEQKFKCPCHGSGFYKDGINFEGPAPRPLERYAIRLADDGQIEIDKSKMFQEELGQWADPACFVAV